jgi:hypothetical protein
MSVKVDVCGQVMVLIRCQYSLLGDHDIIIA